jgi:hypothetical protein
MKKLHNKLAIGIAFDHLIELSYRNHGQIYKIVDEVEQINKDYENLIYPCVRFDFLDSMENYDPVKDFF